MAEGTEQRLVILSDTLRPGVAAFDDRGQRTIRIMLDYWAARAVTQMRTEARWTDRTTNARNGLAAQRISNSEGGSIVLYHTVPYGIWLEIRWSGRYAIIGPTMNAIAPQILQSIGEAVMRTTRI